MRAAVIGAGAIGLCAAEALTHHGVDVCLIDAGSIGSGASAGNAGWITPGLCTPLPAPGVVPQALRWMLDRRSPLLVHPRLSLLPWSLAFCRSAASESYARAIAALVAFGARAIPALEALADRGVHFELHRDGLLFVALTESALEQEQRALGLQRDAGYQGRVELLDAAAVTSLEPGVGPRVIGGLYARDECHVRPESLAKGLGAALRRNGATLREHAEVRRLRADGSGWRVQFAEHGTPDLVADRVVICAGVPSRGLLRDHGIHLPLQGAKGYSVTVPRTTATVRHPLYLLESKVGISPFAGAIRAAGTLELGARDGHVSTARAQAVEDAARRYTTFWPRHGSRRTWAGFRPTLPDGLPAIGEVAPGLFVATGHVMLGITLAAATAEALAPIVCGQTSPSDLATFNPIRFRGRSDRQLHPRDHRSTANTAADGT